MRPRDLTTRDLARRDVLRLGGVGFAGATLLAGCGSSSASSFPTRPITMIVSYEPGGGTDVGARTLQPYLEEELGTSLTIVNKPGAGGWVGWTELVNAKPDGYTIGFINTPNLQMGYLNPAFERDNSLADFAPIANQVTDYGAIAVRADDDRFETIEDLMEFAATNRVTATSTGVGSDDHLSSLALNDQHGTKFEPIHNKGSADSKSAVLGGHVDVMFANVGEIKPVADEGSVRVLAVSKDDEERSEFLPDVPTLKEAGYPGVASWSSRGIAAPAGVEPKVLEVLTKAVSAAIQNPEHEKEMSRLGLAVEFYKGKEYLNEILEPDEQLARELGQKYIW